MKHSSAQANEGTNGIDAARERMEALYGENHEITGGDYDRSLAVKCINGTFVGQRSGDVIAYRGIPYVGHQPVEEYRWKAPVECTPDDGVYEAHYFGRIPCQMGNIMQIGSLYPTSEACLYLNVWKHAEESTEKKPVIVWIHGGAFEIGSTAEPREEGTAYVQENPDIVFASIEYRLGVFGFFHLSHLEDGADYPDAQNLGIMDQMMALKWIHDNIAAFGGDPENVTIIGESAGACSVCLLPLIEGSHRYFRHVIAESGTPLFTRSVEEAIGCTDELMDSLGCKTVADLKELDAETLVKAASVIAMRVWAERDGNYLPLDPFAEYVNGAAKDIDILLGCNKDELGFMAYNIGAENCNALTADGKAQLMTQLTVEERALIESFCENAGDVTPEYSAENRFFDQIVFIAPMFRLSESQALGGGRAYAYFFTPESSVPLMRCAHTMEINTVFNHPEETFMTGRRLDETFSKTLRRMWIQFAKIGDPSLAADISPDGQEKVWPMYDLKSKYVMLLDEFNIHPEKETGSKIVDWDRTYFMTKYYFF